jgi:hypothetical protein
MNTGILGKIAELSSGWHHRASVASMGRVIRFRFGQTATRPAA